MQFHIDTKFMTECFAILAPVPNPVDCFAGLNPVLEKYAAELGIYITFDNSPTGCIALGI